MSKAYDVESKTKDKPSYFANRYKILELLLPRTNLSQCVGKQINTPLHWCVYNGDVKCGMKLFKARPFMLMEYNFEGDLAFDLIFKKEIRREFFKESITLMRKIIIDFTALILKFLCAGTAEENNLMKSCDVGMQQFYQFMKQLKDVVKESKEKAVVDQKNG
jgi:hypothetical protein